MYVVCVPVSVEVVPRVKRAAVEKVEEEDIREEIEGQGEMERGEKEEVEVGGEVKEDDDILPVSETACVIYL